MIVRYEDIARAIYGLSEGGSPYGKAGAIMLLRGANINSLNRPLSHVFRVILEAVLSRHAEVFYNSDGLSVGYVIWAFAESPELKKGGRTWFSINKTNQAESGIYIVDFVAKRGYLNDIIDFIFSNYPLGFRFVKYENKRRRKFSLFKQNRSYPRRDTQNLISNRNFEKKVLESDAERIRLSILLSKRANNSALYSSIDQFKFTELLGKALHVIANCNGENIGDVESINFFGMFGYFDQVICFSDETGQPRSLIVWGWLSTRTVAEWGGKNITKISRFEANEGENLSLLYYCGEPESLKRLIHDWIENVAKDFERAYVFDRNEEKLQFAEYSPNKIPLALNI